MSHLAIQTRNLLTLCRYGAFLPDELTDWPPPTQPEMEIEPTLADAVARACDQLRRPRAMALSGGLDSTTIAALARDRLDGAYVLDSGEARDQARAAADELGLALEVLALRPEGVLETSLDDVVAALGGPTHSAAPFGFLALYRRMKAQGAASVLTGDGADELFAGHAYHAAPHPAWLEGDELWRAYRAVRGLAREIDIWSLFRSEYLAEYWPRRWEATTFAREVASRAAAVASPHERLRFVDVAVRMRSQCVWLQERLCRFAGLGYAAPFSNHAVVAAALGTPLRSGRADRQQKAWLRRFLARRLGASRWWRLEKEPMGAYTGRALESLPRSWQEAISDESVRRHGIFRSPQVARLREAPRRRARYLPRALVVVATTHRWLEGCGVWKAGQSGQP